MSPVSSFEPKRLSRDPLWLSSTLLHRPTVAAFLQKKAAETGRHILSLSAERVESDPFAEVKKMIEDLVVKFMEEANEVEAEADKLHL